MGEQLNLHIATKAGTLNPLNDDEGFCLGSEEGFEQVIFRCLLDTDTFIEMVDVVIEKLNDPRILKEAMSFNFDSNLEDDPKLGILIKLVHKKGAIHSKVQIRTSHEKLKTFFTEIKKKLEYRTRD